MHGRAPRYTGCGAQRCARGAVVAETRRKIATLLSASVVGYERLLQADEPRTLAALNARRACLRRLVAESGGREVGSVADSHIIELPSAGSALQCAVAIQQATQRDNESVPPEERLLLRLGLHVGEVLEESGGNLLGEGVDVAAQVQALAAPGGICLSGAMHDLVKNGGDFEHIGERKLKNVAEPITAYQVVAPGVERARFHFWAELKRRNVVKVGAAYGIVAWVLVQAASIILPTFDTPEQVMRGVVISVVAGFPVALILAWIYELTPLGLARSNEPPSHAPNSRLTGRRLIGTGIGVAAAAVVLIVVYRNMPSAAGPETARQETIAVLAFDNLSADASDEYFSDGVADELLNVLARIPEFKVASRTSSFSFKGQSLDVATIAAKLMVENVLEGSVRRAGDRVRITATLIQNEAVLWTETYDRSLQDIFAVQSEIAHAVTASIMPVLSPESERTIAARPTNDLEAYDYYLRGLQYLHQPAETSTLSSAAALFDRAIELDPRFAAAWAARCEADLGRYEFNASEQTFFDQAQADCRQAWKLDNSLWEVNVALGRLYRISGLHEKAMAELEAAIIAQPHAVQAYLELGTSYSDQNKPEQAEAMFKRAIEVDRGYWDVYRLYGNFLYEHERYREAIEQYNLVVEFTPDSGIGFDNLGNAYWAIGDFERAAAAFERSLAIRPSRWAYSNLGSMQYYLGEFAAAVENQLRAIELAPDNQEAWGRLAEAYRFIPGREADAVSAYSKAAELAKKELLVNPDDWVNTALLGLYYAHTGRRDEAEAQLRRALELAPAEPTAYYFDALGKRHDGNTNGVYAALEKALELGLSPVFITTDPDLAPLLSESRFAALINQYAQH